MPDIQRHVFDFKTRTSYPRVLLCCESKDPRSPINSHIGMVTLNFLVWQYLESHKEIMNLESPISVYLYMCYFHIRHRKMFFCIHPTWAEYSHLQIRNRTSWNQSRRHLDLELSGIWIMKDKFAAESPWKYNILLMLLMLMPDTQKVVAQNQVLIFILQMLSNKLINSDISEMTSNKILHTEIR